MFLALSLLAGTAPVDPDPYREAEPDPGPELEPFSFEPPVLLEPRLPLRRGHGRQGVLPGKRVLERKPQWVNVDKTLAFHCPSCGAAPGAWCNRRTLGRRPFHMARIQAAEGTQ